MICSLAPFFRFLLLRPSPFLIINSLVKNKFFIRVENAKSYLLALIRCKAPDREGNKAM